MARSYPVGARGLPKQSLVRLGATIPARLRFRRSREGEYPGTNFPSGEGKTFPLPADCPIWPTTTPSINCQLQPSRALGLPVLYSLWLASLWAGHVQFWSFASPRWEMSKKEPSVEIRRG
jgi:hypothetical protein